MPNGYFVQRLSRFNCLRVTPLDLATLQAAKLILVIT